MALLLTRAVSMKFQIVGKQLREVSQSWFCAPRTLLPARNKARSEDVFETPAHTFNHLHKNGEMNHMSRYRCGVCDAEMHLAPTVEASADTVSPPHYRWQCVSCGAIDDTSFRICRCGRQTVLDKHAASARELPVSLNAGGCTECERCVICDGILAVGNLKWFYGRWTHLYPDTEFDGRTQQQYTVTRERSKYYGFHCHFSCYETDPQSVDRCLDSRTPEWYVQGLQKQRRDEAVRLHKEGRCGVCKGRLDLLSRLLDHDRHPSCR
jgi:hypothetical protein